MTHENQQYRPDEDEIPAWHRAKGGEPRTGELRGLVPMSLLQRLDAIQLADGAESRMDVIIPVLEEFALKRLHAATVLLRTARVNPLLPDALGVHSDAGRSAQ